MKVKSKVIRASYSPKIKHQQLLSTLDASRFNNQASRRIRDVKAFNKSGRFYGEEDIDELSPELSNGSMEISSNNGLQEVPSLFTSHPFITDSIRTETSDKQDEVVDECLPCLSLVERSAKGANTQGVPKLDRSRHVTFLHNQLRQRKGRMFDASRLWFPYWCLTGLNLLGENVDEYCDQ